MRRTDRLRPFVVTLAVATAAACEIYTAPDQGSADGGGSGDDASRSPDAPSGDDGAAPTDGSRDGSSGGDAGPDACAQEPCAVQIATGGDFACARLSTGSVRCWGSDTTGELGGDAGLATAPGLRPAPADVPGVSGATWIATGGQSAVYGAPAGGLGTACSAANDGTVLCWGNDGQANLGRGDDAGATPAFDTVPRAALVNAKAVSLGFVFGCAITTDDDVACWGYDANDSTGRPPNATNLQPTPARVPLPLGETPVRLSAGWLHACVATASRHVYCWGYNGTAQLGRPNTDLQSPAPQLVPGVSAVSVAAGYSHTCAVDGAGAVTCWGSDAYGQLGRGPTAGGPGAPAPALVGGDGGPVAIDVAAGDFTSCALLSDGSVSCWGYGGRGAIGNGAVGLAARVDVPVKVDGVANAVQISAGGEHACALVRGGTIACWGWNTYGQLGSTPDGGSDPIPHPTAMRVPL